MLRMARAGKRLGADQLFFSEVDLRLIPVFDPAIAQSLIEIDPRSQRLRMPELEVVQDFQEHAGIEWLLQRRQHL